MRFEQTILYKTIEETLWHDVHGLTIQKILDCLRANSNFVDIVSNAPILTEQIKYLILTQINDQTQYNGFVDKVLFSLNQSMYQRLLKLFEGEVIQLMEKNSEKLLGSPATKPAKQFTGSSALSQ